MQPRCDNIGLGVLLSDDNRTILFQRFSRIYIHIYNRRTISRRFLQAERIVENADSFQRDGNELSEVVIRFPREGKYIVRRSYLVIIDCVVSCAGSSSVTVAKCSSTRRANRREIDSRAADGGQHAPVYQAVPSGFEIECSRRV